MTESWIVYGKAINFLQLRRIYKVLSGDYNLAVSRFAILTISISLLSTAFAEEKEAGKRAKEPRKGPPRPEEFLKAYDQNSDQKISKEEFERGERVARLDPAIREKIFKRLDKNDDGFLVTTSNSPAIQCKAGMIAAGCGAFGPNRPPLENIEAYEGSSVFYMVGQREQFRDKNIVIAGGGDSAVDWAISLSELAKKVYVVHRRPKFRAAPESVAKMHALAEEGKIDMVVPYQLKALHGADGKLDSVEVATLEGESKQLEADALLAFFGLSMELGPIAEWGLNLDHSHIKVTPAACETSTSGIYAIGDIATYEGKLKLILCGFSEAAMACHAAYKLVYPNQELHFEYSTSKGVDGEKS